jgi:hypothetical protein
MKPVWLNAAEDIATDLLLSCGQEVDYLSITEGVGEWIRDHGLESERDQMVDYVSYLVDNAEVEVTLPKERL